MKQIKSKPKWKNVNGGNRALLDSVDSVLGKPQAQRNLGQRAKTGQSTVGLNGRNWTVYKNEVHIRATAHFKEHPLSPFWTVHFGPDSGKLTSKTVNRMIFWDTSSQINIVLYAYECRLCLWQLISVKASLRLYQTVTSFELFWPIFKPNCLTPSYIKKVHNNVLKVWGV